ncbi:hypothetical protein [Halocatena halophila]|uniref:hypothetical protein n=1 Tax=Halocatena halophila TaxID=2814576 RepID=UPI002ED651F7
MDRYPALVIVIAVLVLSGVFPGTVSNGTLPALDNTPEGETVTSFMQTSAVSTESTVQREMWEAEFESAKNESEKRRLIEERSEQLSDELSSIKRQQSELEQTSSPQAYTDAYTTHVVELRRSVGNISETANESNVNSTQLATLRKEACSVPLLDRSEALSETDLAGIDCPDRENESEDAQNDSASQPTENQTTDETNSTETPSNTTTETPTENETATPDTNETTNTTPTETPPTETPTNPPEETETETPTESATNESPQAPDDNPLEGNATPEEQGLLAGEGPLPIRFVVDEAAVR